MMTTTTLTVLRGGFWVSFKDVSPEVNSWNKLWMFLVPGRVPHDEKASCGMRVLR